VITNQPWLRPSIFVSATPDSFLMLLGFIFHFFLNLHNLSENLLLVDQPFSVKKSDNSFKLNCLSHEKLLNIGWTVIGSHISIYIMCFAMGNNLFQMLLITSRQSTTLAITSMAISNHFSRFFILIYHPKYPGTPLLYTGENPFRASNAASPNCPKPSALYFFQK
jgi:hypothetical protein